MGFLLKDSDARRAGLFIFGGVMQYLALLKQKDGSYRLEEYVTMPFDLGLEGAEPLVDRERLEDNLKALKQSVGRKWPSVIYAGIQSQYSLLRTMELPRMELHYLKESFKYEFSKYFPIPVEEAIYDIALIDYPIREDSALKGEVVQCQASAVRRVLVENLMLACNKVGIRLAGIEPSPLAMLRCLMGPYPPSGFNIYALAGVVSSYIIATYRDNGIVYRNTTQSFAVSDSRDSAAGHFARDIQTTINFASTQIRGFSADKIYVSGYGAQHREALVENISMVSQIGRAHV